jgi:hypothetical protein
MFWLPPLGVKGVLLANYLPAVLVGCLLIEHLLDRSKLRAGKCSFSTLFALFGLAGLAATPSLVVTETTSTDLIPTTYTMLSALIFLRSFEDDNATAAGVSRAHLLLWVIAVFAVLTKLSAVTPALIAITYSWLRRTTLGGQTLRRTLYLLLAFVGIWVLRNFLLSGCLIYPLDITCADTRHVAWSVGPKNAEWMRSAVQRWARMPGVHDIASGAAEHWLQNWLREPQRGGQIVQALRGMVGLPLVVMLYLLYLGVKQNRRPPGARQRKRAAMGPWSSLTWVFLIALGGLLFGFFLAPDPRFWWGPLLILLVLPLVALASRFLPSGMAFSANSAWPVIILVLLSFEVYILNTDNAGVVRLDQVDGKRALIPTPPTREIRTADGIIFMPVRDDRCWLAPKPCSPIKPQGLEQYQIGPYWAFGRKQNNR